VRSASPAAAKLLDHAGLTQAATTDPAAGG
jgi:hypothetical protein